MLPELFHLSCIGLEHDLQCHILVSLRQAHPDCAGQCKNVAFFIECTLWLYISFHCYKHKSRLATSVRYEVGAAEAKCACAAVKNLLGTRSDAGSSSMRTSRLKIIALNWMACCYRSFP